MKEKNGIDDTAALSPKFTFNPKEGIDNPALVINDDIELSVLIKPRVCALTKKNNEVFGFYLRAEKGKQGHIIREVEPGSHAQLAGLYDADRVLEINGEFVDNMEHSKVVSKIKRSGNQVTFLVVDGATYEDAKMQNLNFAEIVQAEHGTPYGKPRLCYVEKPPNGFDFQLCSHDGVKGQFTLSIQPGGAAEKGGLQMDDRLIEVNGVNIEGCTHLQVARKLGLSPLICDDEEQVNPKQTTEDQSKEHPPLQRASPSPSQVAGERESVPKPRLCHLVKGSKGYGFQLYSITDEPGAYIQQVIPDEVGYKAGIRTGDIVIEVNGKNIEKVDYEDVLLRIKENEDKVTLLVMNKDEYWHCKDNNIAISKEPDSEDNEMKTTRNPDKGIFSSFDTKNTSRRNSSGHPVNKLRISGRLKKNT
ncbi:Na(+)/H(+) exchange regulatory cofactor NHE-RF3-like isoform X3 [Hemitrygon akajei]|uniref:Na(+)/H(+) exchange regulatory cofactor NHE-RF3-like isoform X3 n=1 Tax=Hemitrygon akajei TaxID=2704970 RepID=UPI003BFA0E1F